jgi:thiol peroxidase
MTTTNFKGTPVKLSGDMLAIGTKAPDFELVQNDLSRTKLSDYTGKRVVLNIFPSIDTGVCAASVRKFNEEASKLNNTTVLCISKDLPFANGRFCSAEGISNVDTLSTFDSADFDANYPLVMTEGPLQGLNARAVIVVDEAGTIIHTELVDDIVHEPNYDNVMEKLG